MSKASQPYIHIWNQAAGRLTLFKKPADFQRFQLLLHLTNTTQTIRVGNELRRSKTKDKSDVFALTNIPDSNRLVHISGFCLMKKHFHLLVQPTTANNVARFVQKLGTAYAMYYNEKYAHTGGLFQGPYSSEELPTRPKATAGLALVHLQPLETIDQEWRVNPYFKQNYVDEHLLTHEFSSYPIYRTADHPARPILSGQPPIQITPDTIAKITMQYAPFNNN